MRNRLIVLVGGLILLAVLGGAYATPVSAQFARALRPVVVRNVDEKGRTPYMEFQGVSCSEEGAATCTIVFPPVPAGNRLVLEHVNASINLAAVKRTAVLLPQEAIFVLPAHVSDPDLVIVNEPILAYFESGQTPVFQIVVNEGAEEGLVTVALSGYLVSLEP